MGLTRTVDGVIKNFSEFLMFIWESTLPILSSINNPINDCDSDQEPSSVKRVVV